MGILSMNQDKRVKLLNYVDEYMIRDNRWFRRWLQKNSMPPWRMCVRLKNGRYGYKINKVKNDHTLIF